MRVVITGGAGFIGSHLVDHYLKAGRQVIVVDNLITGKDENIAQHIEKGALEFIKQDVCTVGDIHGEIDAILHFACPASPFDYLKYPVETLRVMSIGTQKMLELAKKKEAKFFLASTSEVYGDPVIHPQKEEYPGNVSTISPRAVYDEGKRFAEVLTLTYHRKFNMKIGIIRIFNTYGERMRAGDGRVVPSFISEALKNNPLPIFGDGKQTRSFCYISDMVDAISRAVEIDYPYPINIGNPAEYTILELAEKVKKLCKSKSEYEYFPLPDCDPKKRRPDISKAKQLLDWQPVIDLESGLKKVIDWFRRQDD
jgi:dTDP-glucose 4,6-dehydratase